MPDFLSAGSQKNTISDLAKLPIFRRQWIGFLALIGLVILIAVAGGGQTHWSKEQEERTHLANLANISADIIEQRLLATDAVLSVMIQRFPKWSANPGGWNEANRELEQLESVGSGTDLLLVLSDTGKVLAANRHELLNQDFSHRHYFQKAQEAKSSASRILSPPFQTVFGNETFTLSRRLQGPKGEFIGVVMATMDRVFFTKLLSDTRYAPDMWESLVHGSGIQILRTSEESRSNDKQPDSVSSPSFFQKHLELGQLGSLFELPATPGQEASLVAAKTINPVRINLDSPLVVAVGRSTTAIYREWRYQVYGWGTVLIGFFLLGMVGLRWYQRRQQQTWNDLFRKQLLVDTSTDGIHVLDTDGYLRDANPAFLSSLGLDQSAIGKARVSDWDVGTPLPRILSGLQSLYAKGGHEVVETSHRSLDGTEYDVELHCHSINIDGEHLIFASSRDITLRKKALAQLALREQEMQAIFDAEPACVKVLSLDGKLQQMNCSGLALLEADSIDQVIGQDLSVFVGAEWRTAFNQLHKKVFAGESGVLQFGLTGLKGTWRWLETQAVPMRNESGEIVALLGLTRDITVARETERELAKLHLAVEQSPEGICITNINGLIEYVNPAFLRTSGYSKEELIGQNPRLLSSGQTPQFVYDEMWQKLSRGEVWTGELLNRRKNGELYIESEIISPVRAAPSGEIINLLAIKQDVTERKRLESELDRYHKHLEELVREKTEALRETNESLIVARDAATEASRAKAAFLSNMSHEIRTPMNGILGMLHVLRRTGVTEKQGYYLEKIAHSANHLLTLINDILDLSKIEAGKLLIEKAPINIPLIMGNVRSIVGELVGAKNVELRMSQVDLPEGLLGDTTRITQALLNYASNAVKFTDKGSVDIRIAQCVQGSDGKHEIRFEVEDTGPGIAEDIQQRLFQAFEQADSSTTRVFKGTGLGLAITRQLATLMGGYAGVESRQGVGSTFWFTVRLEQAVTTKMEAQAAPGATASEIKGKFAGTKILLVEDEPINQEVTTLLLEDALLRVVVANNGQEALAILEQATDIALVLMDMQMPVMDGLEATLRIRLLAKNSRIPVIALTANAFIEDREKCFDAGMDDFLTKPLEPEKLFSVIVKWLS